MKVSNCCYALPLGETYDDLGFCSECMEHAVFEGEEDEESADTVPNVLKAVANEAKKGNIKAKKLMLKYMDKLTEQPN